MKLNIQLFAHTNKTANYNLPQFVGTDKPTWLGDFNEAMSDIDAGMHKNASDIATMQSDVASATSAASKASQDVTTLTGTVNTLSSTVTSVQTTANNASQTASSALNTANTANGKADTNASNITTLQSDVSDLSNNVDDMKPTILYNNAQGSHSNITLSDSSSNYSYLEIFGYETVDNTQIYTKFDVSNTANNLNLMALSFQQNGDLCRLTASSYTINGKSISKISGHTGHINIYTGVVNQQEASDDINITKVLGYK